MDSDLSPVRSASDDNPQPSQKVGFELNPLGFIVGH